MDIVCLILLNSAMFLLCSLEQQYCIADANRHVPVCRKRSPPLSEKLLEWPLSVYNADYRKIKYQNGMDAYFYVRFLRMMVKILLPIWLISWAVLLPLDSVNTHTGKHGLDQFTFGNVPSTQQSRYAGHITLVWIFTSEFVSH